MIIRENRIEHALNTLENGGVIIHETDTLYGFAVDATNTHAINKLNSLKGRNKPLSIMLNKIDEINYSLYEKCVKYFYPLMVSAKDLCYNIGNSIY